MKEKKTEKKETYVKLYVPELRNLFTGGDEKTCLMMAQLEYWFNLQPDGFYKFMTPAKGDNNAYKKGDSWTEEMGMSDSKIKSALRPICTRYKSKTKYDEAIGDKFEGKLYCSYYHKPSHLTFYFRNHEKVNEGLARLSLERTANIFREKHSSKVGKESEYSSGSYENESSEIIDAEVVSTKTKSEITSENISEREGVSHTSNYSPFGDLVMSELYDTKNHDVTILTDDNVVKYDWMGIKEESVPFPSNFEITTEMRAWAKSNNPDIDIDMSTNVFKTYYELKKSEDWLGKWKMWILRERPTKGGSTKKSNMDIYREVLSN